MSKFKKIFAIISCSICVLISVFLVTIKNVKSNVCIGIGSPIKVVVFDHSITGNDITESEKLDSFYNKFGNLTNVSVYDKLINGVGLENKIYQDNENKYASWLSEMKNTNLVVEFIYNSAHDLKVYQGNNSRIISYWSLIFVIPDTENFTDVIVYYSTTNESSKTDESYASDTPLILFGEAKNLSEFVNNLEK